MADRTWVSILGLSILGAALACRLPAAGPTPIHQLSEPQDANPTRTPFSPSLGAVGSPEATAQAGNLPGGQAAPSTVSTESTPFQPVDALAIAREIVIRLNLERQALGLALLETPSGLMELASERAQELSCLGRLTHAAPDDESVRAQTLLVQAGYSGRMGETLLTTAVPPSDVAVTAVAAWMGDAANRALLLEPEFRNAGVGVAWDGETWTIAMLFAERAPE